MIPEARCNECRALLGGYVLHALEPDEAETVRRHLTTCDACAAEHGQLIELPALLDVAGSTESAAEQPPPALEEAVLDRFAREAPATAAPVLGDRPVAGGRRARLAATLHARLNNARRRLARPLPAALTGAAVAAVVTAALIVLPGSGEGPSGHYHAVLTGTSSIPGATAEADLRVLSSGTQVQLDVRDLRGQPDSVYELWCVRDDGVKISAGTFRTDSSGSADVSLTTAAVPGEYHRLSVERKMYSPTSQAGERVMAGDIEYPRY